MHPTMEKLKMMAQEAGLWNFWISKDLAKGFEHLLPQNPQVPHSTLPGWGPASSSGSNRQKHCREDKLGQTSGGSEGWRQ